jgi:protein SCO1/2
MRALIALLVILLSGAAARAGLTENELRAIALSPPANAALPLDVVFRDTTDHRITLRTAMGEKPTLILFADYTCRTVCKPSLAIAADALRASGLPPGSYRLLVIGLDPKDTPSAAADFLQQIGDPEVAASTVALMSDGDNVQKVTQAAGYRYTYDAAADQFAHPAGVIVATATGQITRVLSSLSLNPNDLRLALVEAGQGGVGHIADRLTLLCYGFDPVHGIYAVRIKVLLEAAAAVTLGTLGIFLFVLTRRGRRSRETPA